MGKRVPRNRSKTLPSSPTHSFSSSSSSDFEFRISASPRKPSPAICPADELFYKGQLLPLHLSPRISMVRTLLLASSSTSSSATATTATTASRDSSSSTDSTSSSLLAADLSLLAAGDPCCESSRPSSVADDDDPLKRLTGGKRSTSKYFSLSRIFKKDPPKIIAAGSSAKKTTTSSSSSAKDVIRKYLKKVKPLYDKLSSSSPKPQGRTSCVGPARTTSSAAALAAISDLQRRTDENTIANITGTTTTLSGNCGKIIKRRCVASCPSSMRSSPSHSGVLNRAGVPVQPPCRYGSGPSFSSETSTMEELQNAIQGAIAHCKNSMLQQNSSSFNMSSNNKGKAIQIA